MVKYGKLDTVRLQLWDIAGQDRFASLTRPFYQNAQAAVFVCDVTRGATLKAIMTWKRDLDDKLGLDDEEGKGGKKKVVFPTCIIANKCDLLKGIPEAVEVGARIEAMCTECGIDRWFIGSAKQVSVCMCVCVCVRACVCLCLCVCPVWLFMCV
jgi:Ras-related protein Rab-32